MFGHVLSSIFRVTHNKGLSDPSRVLDLNETFKDQRKKTESHVAPIVFLTCGLNIISTCCTSRGPWMVPDRTLMVDRCLWNRLDLKKRSFW